MSKNNNLTTGSVGKTLINFVMPYLLSYFMQTLYGLADLFVVGIYNTSETTSAVSIGSQITHMITVIIVGMAMGATVNIGYAVGADDSKRVRKVIGTSAVFFVLFGFFLTLLLLIFRQSIVTVMMTPKEAIAETTSYITMCFAGVPFITAYNVISSIYRGLGDSKRPMYFVAAACIINIVLDFLFVGAFSMGAFGAALATVCGQAASVLVSLVFIKKIPNEYIPKKQEIHLNSNVMSKVLSVGVPIALQDGLIQIAFTIIMIIANRRGLIASTSVGITEKLIGFMFLVPSAFLSAISAVTAQNIGAQQVKRAVKSLKIGLTVTVVWGAVCALYCGFFPHTLIGLFTKDSAVIIAGSQYLKSYSFDCMFAAVHFCFSGYFCGAGKSGVSFLHNIISIIAIRIPGAYFASMMFPDTLYPMGWAAPLGSVLSMLICIGFFVYFVKKKTPGFYE